MTTDSRDLSLNSPTTADNALIDRFSQTLKRILLDKNLEIKTVGKLKNLHQDIIDLLSLLQLGDRPVNGLIVEGDWQPIVSAPFSKKILVCVLKHDAKYEVMSATKRKGAKEPIWIIENKFEVYVGKPMLWKPFPSISTSLLSVHSC